MDKEFITYEQALALKELGFDEPCFGYYNNHQPKNNHPRGLVIAGNQDHNEETEGDDLICSAPLYQQAFRWFREKYDLEGVVQQANDYTWYKFSIYRKSNFYTSEGWKVLKSQGLEYETHEEAEQACLDKLIEIVKNK